MNFHHIPGRWRSYQILEGGRAPRIAGVYAIYFGAELVYIGQSSDIANRFSEHKFRYSYGKEIITPWGEVPESTTVTVKVKRSVVRGDWAMWEIRLIHRLHPKFNRHHRARHGSAGEPARNLAEVAYA